MRDFTFVRKKLRREVGDRLPRAMRTKEQRRGEGGKGRRNPLSSREENTRRVALAIGQETGMRRVSASLLAQEEEKKVEKGRTATGDERRGRFDDRLRDRTESSARALRAVNVRYVPRSLNPASSLSLSFFALFSVEGPSSPPGAETSAN